VQVKPLVNNNLHVPPFLHGSDKHGFNFVEVVVLVVVVINLVVVVVVVRLGIVVVVEVFVLVVLGVVLDIALISI
jgi:hypothetical protein